MLTHEPELHVKHASAAQGYDAEQELFDTQLQPSTWNPGAQDGVIHEPELQQPFTPQLALFVHALELAEEFVEDAEELLTQAQPTLCCDEGHVSVEQSHASLAPHVDGYVLPCSVVHSPRLQSL